MAVSMLIIYIGVRCQEKGLNPDKSEKTNYKHLLILKLCQRNSKWQCPNHK